jgi:uracil-DNA glycosylase family 4
VSVVNTVGPPNARLFLVGEAPGKDEDVLGQPFVGNAGRILNWMLSQAGISRGECLIGNVARIRPPSNKINCYFEDSKCTIPKPELLNWISLLKLEIEVAKPNCVVALGATALWALTGEKKISQYRGTFLESSLVSGQKVLATYHPQAVGYDWSLAFTTILDLRKAKFHSGFPEMPVDRRELKYGVSAEAFVEYCKFLMEHPELDKVTLDTETVQPGSHVAIVGLGHSPDHAFSINILNGKTPAMPEKDETLVWSWLAKVLANKKVIIQNATYDCGVLLLNNSIHIPQIWMDTLIAAHAVWPESPRDLGYLASVCLDVPAWKHTSSANKGLYNAADVANTHGVALKLFEEMQRSGNFDTFAFEMQQIPVALMMQLQGLEVDLEVQEKLKEVARKKCEEAESALHKVLGRKINYNSSKQLQQLLYVDLGLPVQYKRRKSQNDPRKVTCDTDALKKLSTLVPNNPVFNLVLDYKKGFKLLTGFLDIDLSPKNTVHTSYNITGSKTEDTGRKSFGRWSSSASIILPYGSGNLQNIPKEARKMYRVRPGLKLVSADYVQAEAVAVAYIINDFRLKDLFKKRFEAPACEKEKYDVHKLTASLMFGVPVDQVTPDQRRIGKTLRHATNYSAGPGVLASRLGCGLAQGKQLLQIYYNMCPQLKIWHSNIQEKLRADRTLTNLLGRKHVFQGRWGDELFRSAYSFIPQSTIGDLLNLSLVSLYRDYGDRISIWIQLHDAIYVCVKEEDVVDTCKIMRKVMVRPIQVNNETMHIDVDFQVGDSWGEMKSLTVD